MKVFILRGISGAGKSTWAKQQHSEAIVVSADHYFIQEDGRYDFDSSKLQQAHRQCYQQFLKALLAKEEFVIVDNTNIYVWEMSPYVMLAQALEYSVEILTFECDPAKAIARKDWVPPNKVRSMAQGLQAEEWRFPPFIRILHRKISDSC